MTEIGLFANFKEIYLRKYRFSQGISKNFFFLKCEKMFECSLCFSIYCIFHNLCKQLPFKQFGTARIQNCPYMNSIMQQAHITRFVVSNLLLRTPPNSFLLGIWYSRRQKFSTKVMMRGTTLKGASAISDGFAWIWEISLQRHAAWINEKSWSVSLVRYPQNREYCVYAFALFSPSRVA